MTTKALIRLIADNAYDENQVNNDKDFDWQRQMTEKYKGKPREDGRELPEGTFTKSASEIANILKQHSEDYGQAMSKLSSYINRTGRDLQGGDKARLNSAKDALRQAYGEPAEGTKTESGYLMNNGNATIGFDESETGKSHLEEGSAETSIYALPPGHNLDDGYLKTGLDETYEQQPTDEVQDMVQLNAATRLSASILNSVQDQSGDTSISSVTADKKWSKDVTDHDDKSAVPKGTFEKSADGIAKTLENDSSGKGQAAERLQFDINRGGSNLSGDEKSKLDKAKSIIKDS